ncbi:cobalt transport protein ATP-binding subunit [Archaeoglobus sulfaticallidus PM70-1]|uniref:ABC transporter ATP-binding protein n=1 Tax=Archaeoglobus sulfaticallidus PM70-1 TaxID=387631 RepID=N0BGQ9_9EURY|nr:ATP-binding cassette domain-containing protein [Archaeoglobus sulfaticallidus]AGK62193.1 cobalt transport protein ATP-binding subunit [Archaeoglobus sulfaticallidus PM70-1]
MIETRDLWFSYGSREVLKGVNFRANKGEVTILLGRNGAGKTTLLMHLNGLLKPSRGEVWIDGVRVKYDRKSLIEVRKKVGFVFQNPDDQIIAPTVWQDVVFGPKNIGMGYEFAEEAIKSLGLKGYEERLCNSLSGGEKRRVAIAGVLAMNPDYIIMDEPTAGLDGFGLKNMIEIIENLRDSGKTFVISTHDLDFAREVGERFVYMDNGEIVHESDRVDLRFANRCGLRIGNARGRLIVIPHNAEIPDVDADFIAAMGTKAKKRASVEKLEVDITNAVLERSILRAIEGHTVMLICSTEMLNVVEREAEKFPVFLEILDGFDHLAAVNTDSIFDSTIKTKRR